MTGPTRLELRVAEWLARWWPYIVVPVVVLALGLIATSTRGSDPLTVGPGQAFSVPLVAEGQAITASGISIRNDGSHAVEITRFDVRDATGVVVVTAGFGPELYPGVLLGYPPDNYADHGAVEFATPDQLEPIQPGDELWGAISFAIAPGHDRGEVDSVVITYTDGLLTYERVVDVSALLCRFEEKDPRCEKRRS